MKLTILYFTIHFLQLKERKLLRSEHTSCSRNCETSFFADMTSNEFTFRPICRSPERIDITPSRPVCRQLFGPIDHSQMHSDLKRELTKMTKETTTRWNFDFENDQPLEGRYLWCSVRSKESKTEAFASSGSVCSRIEESNRSRDTAAAKPKEKFEGRPANLAPLKPELEFLANDKGLSARSSTTKKRPSSGKITGNSGVSFWCVLTR